MSANAISERRNKQIQDAIDGHNWKQALQLCEKRLKKGEVTAHLRAWRAYILSRQADDKSQRRGKIETLELCDQDPPITDKDTIDILQQSLDSMRLEDRQGIELWERAAKAKPQDLEIQRRWFSLASDRNDWKSAQKAAMSLQNNFPKERKFYFWAILMCHLVQIDDSIPEKDRKLFGTLAYRMISKAAQSVPDDPKELLSLPRAIQTSEELYLLLKIYLAQHRHREIVTTLNSEKLGSKSRIAQNDWTFVRAHLLSLEKAELWEEALSFTRSLLTIPDEYVTDGLADRLTETNDWSVWHLLLTATKKLDKLEIRRETMDFAQSFLDRHLRTRNAQLAKLDLLADRLGTNEQAQETFFKACKQFFEYSCKKLHCFLDLRDYVHRLDSDHQNAFRLHVVKYAKITDEDKLVKDGRLFNTASEINALKFEYCFDISIVEGPSAKKTIQDFICQCVQMYRQSLEPVPDPTITRPPWDDVCLIAVMSLVRLSEIDMKSRNDAPLRGSHLVQAAALLEHLLSKSQQNYQALLFLVRIQLLLGAGSLAMKTFSKLSVKHMQYETVAHILFTRLSTTHPHATPFVKGSGLETRDRDPLVALGTALDFYRVSELHSQYTKVTGFDSGSYANVQDSMILQKDLKYSFCRRLWTLERRRIQRLMGSGGHEELDSFWDNETPIDKRSFEAFMNCELPDCPPFEEHLRIGPKPSQNWLNAISTNDKLFYLLNSNNPDGKGTKPCDFDYSQEGDIPHEEMTTAEIENLKIHLLLCKALSLLAMKAHDPPQALDHVWKEIEEWLTSEAVELSDKEAAYQDAIRLNNKPLAPSWIYLHNNFSLLETLKAISVSINVFAKKSKQEPTLSKEQSTRLRALVAETTEGIKSNARQLKTEMSKSGVLGDLLDMVLEKEGDETGAIGQEMEKLIDEPALELFCGDLRESWEEALDGLLQIKVN